MVAASKSGSGSADPRPARPLGLTITPRGRLRLEAISDSIDVATGVVAEAADRIERAFAGSDVETTGLLHLATREVGTELPPSLKWGRRIAEEVLHEVCALPEHEATARDIRQIVIPEATVTRLVEEAPPMIGGEYLSEEDVARVMSALLHHVAAKLDGGDDLAAFLRTAGGGWHAVGRVWFHIAENRDDDERPFAFLATYTGRRATSGSVRHSPLAKALEEHTDDRAALVRLLAPVQRAAEKSAIVAALVESGELFHPLAWTSDDAMSFLEEAEALEGTGVMLRLPKSWQGRRPRQPAVQVRIGGTEPAFGAGALLDFDVSLAIEGEPLTEAEKKKLLRGARRLELLRGQWVEVDPAALRATLDGWRRKAKSGQVGFAEGLRHLAGVEGEDGAADVVAGAWLAEILERLRSPDADPPDAVSPSLSATLRPYQREGLAWLWMLYRLGLGGCLADDMGLGKTIQVLALLLRMKDEGVEGPSLLVVPASLIGNWRAEIERFAPALEVVVAHRSEHADLNAALESVGDADVVITTYATLPRLEPLLERSYAMVVLDEAQAIKNAGTKQARATKRLAGHARFALTGTPIENRLGDLWSLFDFVNPALLGGAAEFGRFVSALEKRGAGYGPLRRLVQPYILRRLKTDRRIIDDLPDKTEIDVYCGLTREQAALYEGAVEKLERMLRELEGIERRGLVLEFLTRFKQICNHPSQWSGDGGFDPQDSGKFVRLSELASTIAERQEKMLVFTQYRQMTEPLAELLKTRFGRPGLVLHGGTAVRTRAKLVKEFQADDGPPFFVLSLKAGGTGLNLTAASHVVHFDRWWNPAVENQATDRAYRIGQHKNVLVHRFVCRGTIEERIDRMLKEKSALADEILKVDGTKALTEMSDEELLAMVRLDLRAALEQGD